MTGILIWAGVVLVVLLVLLAALWAWGPLEQVDLAPRFDESLIGSDIDGYLSAAEAAVPDITPGTQKQVIWAGKRGMKTPLAVVYLHGFSATSQEIRPVPDLVASALGANLYFTRLTGHGLNDRPRPPGAALAAAMPEDWIDDTAEALAIGRRLGERVLIVSTSTGATLAAIAAVDPRLSQDLAGIAMISPNFGTLPPKTRLLDLPFGETWVPWFVGTQLAFEPGSETQRKYWTNSYPTLALFHCAALIRAGQGLDLSKARVPLLAFYSPDDQVLDPAKMRKYLARWGGAISWQKVVVGKGDDPSSHVIAGEIRSPGQTAPTVARILDWVKSSELVA